MDCWDDVNIISFVWASFILLTVVSICKNILFFGALITLLPITQIFSIYMIISIFITTTIVSVVGVLFYHNGYFPVIVSDFHSVSFACLQLRRAVSLLALA